MAKGFLILSPVLATALAAVPNALLNNFDERIVRGEDAPDGAYPQISLKYKGEHNCGGSIIHNEWILTAAHCVYGFEIARMTVYAGSNQRSSGGNTYTILGAYYHQFYLSNILKNSVAVLKVESITYTDKIQSIILETEEIDVNEIYVLSGWGRRSFPSGPFPENLQHIELRTISNANCRKLHQGFNPVSNGELCTLYKLGKGACSEDSGGPLIWTNNGTVKQVGVVSWSQPCANDVPGGFAKVLVYIPCIRQNCSNCI